MLKRHSILLGITISLFLLLIATLYYPGGSQHDVNSVGYDWGNNYLSNLFGEKAVNGADNASRPWAAFGMLFLAGSFALFFIGFSKRIPDRGATRVIRYCGVAATVSALLAVTPLHDMMVVLASTLALVSMFYITVFVFKSKLYGFGILCVVTLLVFYCCNYMYSCGYLENLPVMQKTSLFLDIAWALSLQYFTSGADFQISKKATGEMFLP